jgi:pimeloyl-ACP methyl ester carboxylesterase
MSGLENLTMTELHAAAERPPVVFVHGFVGNLRGSANALRILGRRTLAPDLLGYGIGAEGSSSDISLGAQVREVIACVQRAFGIQTVDLVGHSVGGAIAMLLAAERPSMFRRVVNIEGNFTLEDAFWSASVGRMSSSEAELMLAELRADPAPWLNRAGLPVTEGNLRLAREWLGFQPALTLRQMGRSVVDVTGATDYLDRVQSVFQTHPVYLFAGERSLASWHIPVWASKQAAGSIVITGVGHLMMIEQPNQFIEQLVRVLT